MARWEGGTIITLVQGMTVEQALPFADAIRDRVREAAHPSPALERFERYVTVSCGARQHRSGTEDAPELLLEEQRLRSRSKSGGRNRVAAIATVSGKVPERPRERRNHRDHAERRVIEVVALERPHAPHLIERESHRTSTLSVPTSEAGGSAGCVGEIEPQ